MVRIANEMLAKYFSLIPHEAMGNEGAENVQEVDMRRQNSSLLGLGYGSHSHIFGYFWYKHDKATCFKANPSGKIPPFIGIDGNLEEEMRKFVINNIQTGFERKLFKQLFSKDVMDVFPKEMGDLIALGKITIGKRRITSSLIRRREVILFLKHFCSQERIKAILDTCGAKFNPKKDYISEFNYLYTESD